jgi:plasmid maintenance system killer protein
MWVVYDSQIKKMLDKLPREIQIKYSTWRKLIECNSSIILRRIKSYHYEKLLGKRKGQFSCRLSKSYRVVFTQNNYELKIFVMEVTKHEY